MSGFTLQLKATSADVLAPIAWFIPGADPAGWIEELSRWDVPMDGMRLWVVPASARDRSAIGVLVMPAKDVAVERVLRGQPYRRVGKRLFLPANGVLSPPVSET